MGRQMFVKELTTEQKLQLEAETAWAVGFNALAISDNEEGLLPTGANEAAYVQVRRGKCVLASQQQGSDRAKE